MKSTLKMKNTQLNIELSSEEIVEMLQFSAQPIH